MYEFGSEKAPISQRVQKQPRPLAATTLGSFSSPFAADLRNICQYARGPKANPSGISRPNMIECLCSVNRRDVRKNGAAPADNCDTLHELRSR